MTKTNRAKTDPTAALIETLKKQSHKRIAAPTKGEKPQLHWCPKCGCHNVSLTIKQNVNYIMPDMYPLGQCPVKPVPIDGGPSFYVECCGCGYSAGYSSDAEESIACWNSEAEETTLFSASLA